MTEHGTVTKPIECWLTDMDGVLVHEGTALPGAADLIRTWTETGRRFLILTNNSRFTPRDLQARLAQAGLDVPEEAIWTSALATAEFLARQQDHGTAYVIGEAGLTTAIHEAGWILTDADPDYVVLGETRTYSFESITKAVRLIDAGARFICTNPDTVGPSGEGPLPATGAVSAMITAATTPHKTPYVVGKPNPMMFRSALNKIRAHSETTAMIGDTMDTDIIAGMEAGLHTILVLTGVTTRADLGTYPFRPDEVLSGVAELTRQLEEGARPVPSESGDRPVAGLGAPATEAPTPDATSEPVPITGPTSVPVPGSSTPEAPVSVGPDGSSDGNGR